MATRHERVIIDLDDKFTRPMSGMAAGVSLFRRNLGDADRDLLSFDRHTQDVGRNIDKLSGRLGLLVDVAATLGPALIPTATAAVPLLAGLSNQLGFAAIAGGSTILAFQGVGDALKAVNEQALNPSVANLEKVHEAMAALGPAGRDFVRELQAMRPEMQKLQDAAQEGLFPGMTDGINELTTRMPEVERIIGTVSDTVGDLLRDAGESLASPEWDEFFATLESEARPALEALGQSLGNVTRGLAELWIAFTPLNRDFSAGMIDASKSFADWADGLSQTQGFADFMAYLDETGPQVAATLSALGSALLDVVEAAAPLGGPALAAIRAFSEAISAIADSDIGTPLLAAVAALRAYSLAMNVVEKAQTRMNTAQAAGSSGGLFGGAAVFRDQLSELKAMPAAFREVTTAQKSLAGAQREAGLITAGYTGQLQAINKVTATGFKPSMQALGRLNDSLSKVEMANYGVSEATKRAAAAEAERSRVVRSGLAGVGKTAAGIGALAVATTEVGDGLGITNTAMLGLAGTMLGPWGAAAGAGVGAFLDLKAAGDSFGDTLDRLGAASKAGNITAINNELENTKAQIADINKTSSIGDFFSDIGKTKGASLANLIPGASISSDEASSKMFTAGIARTAAQLAASVSLAAKTSRLAADGFQLTGAGAREAAGGIKAFTFAVRGANEAISRGNAYDSYRMSLLDAKDAAKDAGRTLQRNGEIIRGQGRDMQRAGLQSRQTLRGIAAGALEAASSMKNFDRRTKFIDGARKDFINLAQGMGLSRAAARRLADQLGLVDRMKVNPKVKLDGADAAKSLANGVRTALNNIPREVKSTIRVTRTGAIGGPRADTAEAEGGTIQGQRHPYGDKVLAYLAPGEEVISNRFGQADRYREILKAINANAYASGGTIPGFADGDTVRKRRGNGDGGASPALKRLREELEKTTKTLGKERSARDALISKRNDLRSTVSGAFTSDIFGGSDVWAAGAGDPRAMLKADIAKANAFKSSLYQLKQKGLDGQALAAIASTGDVGKAQALLGLGKSGLADYESLYKQRASAAAAAGKYAGSAVYGAAIAADNKQIKALVDEVKDLRHDINHHNKGGKKRGKDNAREFGREAGRAMSHAGAAGVRRSRRN